MNKKELEALQFVGEILVEIRALSAKPVMTETEQKAVHAFSDAMHNVPRIIAEGSAEQNAAVLETAVNKGIEAWLAVFQLRKPVSVPVDKFLAHTFNAGHPGCQISVAQSSAVDYTKHLPDLLASKGIKIDLDARGPLK